MKIQSVVAEIRPRPFPKSTVPSRVTWLRAQPRTGWGLEGNRSFGGPVEPRSHTVGHLMFGFQAWLVQTLCVPPPASATARLCFTSGFTQLLLMGHRPVLSYQRLLYFMTVRADYWMHWNMETDGWGVYCCSLSKYRRVEYETEEPGLNLILASMPLRW